MEYTTTVTEHDNCIMTIHRPVLTSEERKHRMKLIKMAAEDLVKESEIMRIKRGAKKNV